MEFNRLPRSGWMKRGDHGQQWEMSGERGATRNLKDHRQMEFRTDDVRRGYQDRTIGRSLMRERESGEQNDIHEDWVSNQSHRRVAREVDRPWTQGSWVGWNQERNMEDGNMSEGEWDGQQSLTFENANFKTRSQGVQTKNWLWRNITAVDTAGRTSSQGGFWNKQTSSY